MRKWGASGTRLSPGIENSIENKSGISDVALGLATTTDVCWAAFGGCNVVFWLLIDGIKTLPGGPVTSEGKNSCSLTDFRWFRQEQAIGRHQSQEVR